LKSNRNNKIAEPKAGDTVIQVMTISLFVILLSFFILLNSIAVVNEQKVFEAIGSLLGSFGIKTSGYTVLKGEGENFQIFPAETGNSPVDFSDLFAGDNSFSRKIMILSTPKGSMVRIPADLIFGNSETTINPSGKKILRHLSGIIVHNQYPVEISVHTDDAPAEEGEISNRELSVLQALQVLSYFIETKKISPDRLTALGWGEHRNAFSNQTAETRKLNRRIDILFLHKKMKQKPESGYIYNRFFFKTYE